MRTVVIATVVLLLAAAAALSEDLDAVLQDLCRQRLEEEGARQSLGDALSALEKQVQAIPTPAPHPPGSPASGQPPPTVVIRQAQMAAVTIRSYIDQASDWQTQAQAKYTQARREPDTGKRAELYRQVMQDLDVRDGLVRSATRGLVAAAGLRAERHAAHIQLVSPAFEQLQSLVRRTEHTDTTGRMSAFTNAYNNAVIRAYDTVNRGIGTRFYEVPRATAQTEEPGGIKFSGKRAEALASALDVTSIAFDPVHGKLILAGPKASQKFDLDVFADVLRLAVEEHEPFFSLNPSDPQEWDDALDRADKLLRQQYRTAEIVRRVQALSPTSIPRGSRVYYYTTLDVFDPAIARRANRGHDITTKVVFSPAWLRYSPVGWILYEADLAIKGIASGFLERGGAIAPAPVWDLPDFDPVWLHRDTADAGRANFVLAQSSVVYRGENRLDLAEVRPALYVTDRRAGTDEDLPQSRRNLAISNHFDKHWRDYVDRVPEIARLAMVYRAYVAAHFLAHRGKDGVSRHPGLASRIQRMPGLFPPEQPPLRIVMPIVIRAWGTGSDADFILGVGYGGGVTFGLDPTRAAGPRGQAVRAPGNHHDWLQGLLAAARYEGSGGVEHGAHAAVVLEFNTERLPPAWHLRLASGVGAMVLAAAGLGLFLRRFDWQQIAVAHPCGHCARVHAALGRSALLADGLTAGSVAYLALLPWAAMAYEAPPTLLQTLAAAVLLLALASALVLLGTVWRTALERAHAGALRSRGMVPAAFTGARVACITFAAFLFHSGFSATAIGGSLLRLLTPQVGERVLVILGGVEPVVWAVALGVLGVSSSLLLRWAAPCALNSRPLALYPVSVDSHLHHAAHP